MKDIELITLGETMALFYPNKETYLRYVSEYHIDFAGAESNLAIGMSKLGHNASWISRLGDDEFGHFIKSRICGEGVDVSCVSFDKTANTGIMFKELHKGQETKVTYYRKNSAFTNINMENVDTEIFQKAKILHLSGITPLLGESCLAVCRELIKIAKRNCMLFSFDPNIRKKIWVENDYREIMTEFIEQSDILLMGNDELKYIYPDAIEDEFVNHYCEKNTARKIALKDGKDGALVANHQEKHIILPYKCSVVDPVGAGDGFDAGFLSGILEGKDLITCGKMGAYVGAKATETVSDYEGYPSEEQMRYFFQQIDEVFR